MAVQFCGTCGHPLIPEQLFCQHCGSRTDENATRGAAPVTPGIPVSSAGTLYCGECGALVGGQDRVCRRCGARIEPPIGGVSDPSLSDLPTVMGTPPPGGQASPPPASQTPTGYQTPTPAGYQTPQPPSGPPASMPGYPGQPGGWGASYNPAPSYNESPTFTFGAPPPGAQTPPPSYRPTPPGGGPPRRGKSWPVVLAGVLVVLVLIVGGGILLVLHPFGGNQQANGITPTAGSGTTQTPGVTPSPTMIPSPTPVVLTPETAKAVIQEYYDDINAKNYDAAYDLLAPEYQQTHPLQSFKDGYKTTVQDVLTIVGTTQVSDGIEVDITLQATDNKNGTNVTTNYAGYYVVTLEGGKLLILRAQVNKQ